MDSKEIIVNVVESKTFISLISLLFGVFIYRFYLYIQELRSKYDFSDELRNVVNNYLKNGAITVKEFGALIRIVAQMGNYLGIYREHVQRMMKEFGENGNLNFADGVFEEKENKQDDLDKLSKENFELKKQLTNIKSSFQIAEVVNDKQDDF